MSTRLNVSARFTKIPAMKRDATWSDSRAFAIVVDMHQLSVAADHRVTQATARVADISLDSVLRAQSSGNSVQGVDIQGIAVQYELTPME